MAGSLLSSDLIISSHISEVIPFLHKANIIQQISATFLIACY